MSDSYLFSFRISCMATTSVNAFEDVLNTDLSKFIRTLASDRTPTNEYEEMKNYEHLKIVWIDSDLQKTDDCTDTENALRIAFPRSTKYL